MFQLGIQEANHPWIRLISNTLADSNYLEQEVMYSFVIPLQSCDINLPAVVSSTFQKASRPLHSGDLPAPPARLIHLRWGCPRCISNLISDCIYLGWCILIWTPCRAVITITSYRNFHSLVTRLQLLQCFWFKNKDAQRFNSGWKICPPICWHTQHNEMPLSL